jgi:trimeric autotransporter adhesin
MPNNKLKFAILIIVTIILTLGVSISFQNILAAWQEPNSAPPASNIFPPVYNEHTTPASNVLINKPVGVAGNLSISNGNLVVSTGNIGIGTPNPVDKLSVAGTIRATGDICTDVAGGICLSAGSNSQWSTNGANINNSNTGNVGIGTTNPNNRLTVGTENNPFGVSDAGDITVTGGTDRNWAIFKTNASGVLEGKIGIDPAGNIILAESSGNVGIRMANPQVALAVGASGQLVTQGWSRAIMAHTYIFPLSTPDPAVPRGGGNHYFFIGAPSGDGNGDLYFGRTVAIDNTTPAAYSAKIDGATNQWSFSQAITVSTTNYASDASLKKDIGIIPDALSKVLDLKGVSFKWKDTGRADLGLIAQDVEKVFPQIVATDKSTGLKSVEYANIVAPLIEAMKEQQQQIDELKKEIEILKK